MRKKTVFANWVYDIIIGGEERKTSKKGRRRVERKGGHSLSDADVRREIHTPSGEPF